MSKYYAMCYFDHESGSWVPLEVRPESDHLNLVAEITALKEQASHWAERTFKDQETITKLKEQVAQLQDDLAAF